MTVETLQLISTILFVLAGVMLVLTVVLFFILKIPSVVGDITGSTARKAIQNIREQNEESGDKAYNPSPVNRARGKITDKMTPSGHLVGHTSGLGLSVGTEELNEETLVLEAQQAQAAEETTLLGGAAETTLLSPETTVLGSETTVLSAAQPVFAVEYEVGFTGSAEIIE